MKTTWIFLIVMIVWSALGQGTLQITFDGPPAIPLDAHYAVSNYIESGMSFNPGQGSYSFGRVGVYSGSGYPRSGLPDDGSAYLDALIGDSLKFSFTNGSVFSLLSVDLAEYSTVVSNALTVPFIGYHPDGSTVSTSFTTDGIIDGTGPLADFQTFYFTGFTNLASVEIPTFGWSLDNLVVSVPEPSAGALVLAAGLLFCAGRLWRVRKYS